MKFIKILIFFTLLTPIACADEALGDPEASSFIQAQLVNAKFNGMCGAIYQILSFHISTQMEGGTEFINRFLNTEAARLGHKDTEAFLSQCKESTATYEIMMETLSTSEQKDTN